MYVPSSFAQTDQSAVLEFVRRHSFGLLVSQYESRPLASHLPFLIEAEAGRITTLVGHMARANPQWKSLAGQESLVIFSGPHAYISPTWYEADNVVPTWNYVAVHLYGTVELVEDEQPLGEIVSRMVQHYEQSQPIPWQYTDTDFARKLLQQIVGFRITVTTIDAKWKLSQNQPTDRRHKVIRALKDRADSDSQAIAVGMLASLPRENG